MLYIISIFLSVATTPIVFRTVVVSALLPHSSHVKIRGAFAKTCSPKITTHKSHVGKKIDAPVLEQWSNCEMFEAGRQEGILFHILINC